MKNYFLNSFEALRLIFSYTLLTGHPPSGCSEKKRYLQKFDLNLNKEVLSKIHNEIQFEVNATVLEACRHISLTHNTNTCLHLRCMCDKQRKSRI